MEVILREDVEKLGQRGQLVKVAPGYARNFLLPKRMAVEATESNKKIIEQERQSWLRKEAKEVGDAQELAKLMANVVLTMPAKAGEEKEGEAAHLFGSVTAQDIAHALEAQKYTIDRRKIVLPDPIRALGEYKVPVKLHKDVTVDVTVNVVREG
jgi:large subunit ribosomal protein L9